MLTPGIGVSILLGLLYNFANGLGRPPLIWLVSELSREGRGALMGLQIMVAGIGWLTASSLGGWLVVTHGFGSLGVLAAVCGLGSAAFAMLSAFFSRSRVRMAEQESGGVATAG